jgi:Bacterial PH domain
MQPEQGQGPQPPGGGLASPRFGQAVTSAAGANAAPAGADAAPADADGSAADAGRAAADAGRAAADAGRAAADAGRAAADAGRAAGGSDGMVGGSDGAAQTDRSAAPSVPGNARPSGPGSPPPAQSALPTAQSAPPTGQSVPPTGQGAPLTIQGEPLTGPKMFRLPGAIVAWWAWMIFAGFFLVDIIISGRNHTAVEIAATLVFVTGVVYACALRPRVIADPGGITVQNPLRDHRIPWGSVAGVDLKESVQVHCVKEPGATRGKVIHSWALYTQRRSRLRSELLKQGDRRRLPRSSFAPDEKTSSEAQKLSRQPAAQIMATQLDDLAQQARQRAAAAGPRVVSWAWPAVAAIVVPGIVLVLVITVFR